VSAAVLIVVLRMCASDVARRCTGVPGRRPDASVSASRGYGYSARKLRHSWFKDYHKF